MCVIPSASSLASWCSGQRPGAGLGGPLGTAADGGEQLAPVPCSTSPLPSWLLPAGRGAGRVLCCPWLSLHGTCWHLPWQDPLEHSVPAGISVFIVLPKWLLGKVRSGLGWPRHPVCVEAETAPNQEGEQNPRPNEAALPDSQPGSASPGRAEGPAALPGLGPREQAPEFSFLSSSSRSQGSGAADMLLPGSCCSALATRRPSPPPFGTQLRVQGRVGVQW